MLNSCSLKMFVGFVAVYGQLVMSYFYWIQPARGWCATVKRDCANCIHLILPLRIMAGGAPAPCGRH